MRCSELMKRSVAYCPSGTSVLEAASIMSERDLGFLPVCNDQCVAVGVITDRDIAVRVLAERLSYENTRVADVFTPTVVSCRSDDDLEVAEERMSTFRKSRIVCTGDDGRLEGVISLSDLAKLESDGAGIVAAAIASRETSTAAHTPFVSTGRLLECGDVMTSHVECCFRDDLVATVAEVMRDRDVGFVPICDDTGRIVGTLTDRDLAVRVVAGGRSLATTRAVDVITPELVYCAADDPLTVAEDLMSEYKKSRIVCAGEDGRPSGIISLADIARVEAPAIVSRILRDVASALV